MTTSEEPRSTVAPPDGPAAWTDATRAWMVVSAEAAELADRAAGFVPIPPGFLHSDGRVAYPGSMLSDVAGLRGAAERLLTLAVVAERLSGTSWEQIGATLDASKQAVHERFRGAERRFKAELARPQNPHYTGEFGQLQYVLHGAALAPEAAAARLDKWVRERKAAANEHADEHPVSGGMVRAQPTAELAMLSDRSHALFAGDGSLDDTITRPAPAELLAIARRELVLWNQDLDTPSRNRTTRELARGRIAQLHAEIARLEQELDEHTDLNTNDQERESTP